MNELRRKFEALPEIVEIIEIHGALYCDKGGWYLCPDDGQFAESYLDGAWYAFQEQQKKIDEALEFTCDVHSENWQESMHCIQELLK